MTTPQLHWARASAGVVLLEETMRYLVNIVGKLLWSTRWISTCAEVLWLEPNGSWQLRIASPSKFFSSLISLTVEILLLTWIIIITCQITVSFVPVMQSTFALETMTWQAGEFYCLILV
jgi:hypothetical protein